MVRISSTGEIIPDDPQPRNRGSGDHAPQQRQGSVRHENYNEQEQQAMQGEGGQVSIFDNLNQRLLALGLPRWNAGPYVIEPIVSVAFLLAGLFLGIPGLLMGLVLFGVVKLSQSGGIPGQDLIFGLGRNQNQNTNHRNSGNDRKPRGGGGGHRLGRT